MSWDVHINNIIKKANRNLWFIKRTIGPYAPTQAKKTLYLTLVRSILEYCTIIWAPITRQNLIHIESIQRRATKFITGMPYASYKERVIACNLLPLSFRREILDCCFHHKARTGILGQNVLELSNRRPPRPNPRLDPQANLLQVLPVNTETYANFYTRHIVKTWNSVPIQTRGIPHTRTSKAFRNSLIKIYFQKLNNTFTTDSECTWVTHCRCTNCRN